MMDEKDQQSRFHKAGLVISISFLALTQVPGTINETLKLGCALSTWADYASFWQWNEIPLDSRVRYCNGGSIEGSDKKDNQEQ